MPFTPTDIAGLRCWEADNLALSNGSPVSAWTDASASAITFTGSGTARPTYQSSVSEFNNKPGVQFDGTNDLLTASESPTWGDFTIVVVWSAVAWPLPAFARIFDSTYDTGTWIGRSPDAAGSNYENVLEAGVRQSSTPYGQQLRWPATGAHLVTSRRSSGIHGIYLDGRYNSYLKNVGTTALSANPYQLGGDTASGNYANIRIAAVFTINRALTFAEMDSLHGYLGTKYGLTIYPFSPMFKRYYCTSFEAKHNDAVVMRVLTSDDLTTFIGVPAHYPAVGAVPNPQWIYSHSQFVIAHSMADETASPNWQNSPACAQIAIATSPDGLTYTTAVVLDYSASFFQIFAGAWLQDSGTDYFIFPGNSTSMGSNIFTLYYITPTAGHESTFDAWTSPVALTGDALLGAQDPCPFKDGSSYYILRSTDERLFKSSSPFSGYTRDAAEEGWSGGIAAGGDGPRLVKFSSTHWRLYQEPSSTHILYNEINSTWPSATAFGASQAILGPQSYPTAVLGTDPVSGLAYVAERSGNYAAYPLAPARTGRFASVFAGVVR